MDSTLDSSTAAQSPLRSQYYAAVGSASRSAFIFTGATGAFATTIGVPPLSQFGFHDDLAGETLEWHAALRGLATVSALIVALQRDPSGVSDSSSVVDDLRKLEFGLNRANDQGIRFCLLVRTGNSTSGHERSVRQGTAF